MFVGTIAIAALYLWRVNPEVWVARTRSHEGTKHWDKILLGFFFTAVYAIVPVAALDDGLGSLWALVPAGLASALLILRAQWEDQTLQAELPGYQDYARRVRYKLLPGVW